MISASGGHQDYNLFSDPNALNLLDDYIKRPYKVYFYNEDFDTPDADGTDVTVTNRFTVTNATSGTATQTASHGGIVQLAAGAATANQGVTINLPIATILPAAGKHIFFETRVKLSAAYATQYLYAGLGTVHASVTHSSGSVETSNRTNHAAFHISTGGLGKIQFMTKRASQTGGAIADVHTVASATEWVTLGFHIDGLSKVKAFVNDSVNSTEITTATQIPNAIMAPTFSCIATGTGSPTMDVDYVRILATRL